MAGWHHQLNGHEFVHNLGDSEGQGSLAFCNSLGWTRVTDCTATTREKANKKQLSFPL